jgi:hypothetical protein
MKSEAGHENGHQRRVQEKGGGVKINKDTARTVREGVFGGISKN